jgi:hypothetical protein
MEFPMKTLEIRQAPFSFQEYVRDLGPEPVILTLDGKPVAVVQPVRDADLETVSLSLNPEFLALIEDSRRQLYTQAGTSSEDLRRELGIPARSNRAPRTRNRKVKAKRRKSKATD